MTQILTEQTTLDPTKEDLWITPVWGLPIYSAPAINMLCAVIPGLVKRGTLPGGNHCMIFANNVQILSDQTQTTPCKSQSLGAEPGPNSSRKSGDGGQAQATPNWWQRIVLAPMLVAAYLVAFSIPIVVAVGVYHYVGWLCCGVPL